MSKGLKITLVIVGLLIVFAVVAKSQGWIGKSNAVEVELAEVQRRSIVETVIASGKIQPETEVKISSEVSGEIIELPVVEGQEVQKGDLLIRINPDLYQSAVNRAQASLNSARSSVASSKAQLKEAERAYDRSKKLYQEKVISDAEWDAAQRSYEVGKLGVESSEFQLASARATYNEARDNLKRTAIYAPHDGTISMLNSELGERVVGTAQMAGTEIMRLADLENMEVLVEVNENDIIRVNRGDTAIIEVDAYLDREFKGVVTEIANSARLQQGLTSDQVTNFEVKVRILKSSYADLVGESRKSPFRPGMTASVEIKTQRKGNVLTVPIEAVTTRSDTSKEAKSYRVGRSEEESPEVFEVVFRYEDGKARLAVVETGIQDDEFIEVTRGLSDGGSVISGPYSLVSKKLTNGMRVEKKEDESKEDEKED